ncbi:MAG: hypothetical protein JO261_14005 [Alphaproteobacteria bacterium]|nr:hypothetical protein [Alphaproteobacteria bacterium]MBV9694807.1 hypothetical protein [Alphaproteobacteria bacterium]
MFTFCSYQFKITAKMRTGIPKMPRVRRNGSDFRGATFMRLKVQKIGNGLHPNEIVVKIETLSGAESLVLDKRSLDDSSISVGAPLARANGSRLLVELPQEAMSGAWRVWVKQSQLIPEKNEVQAA